MRARTVLMLFLLLGFSSTSQAQTYYFNDFDGGETLGSGIFGGFSGGGGVESVQGFAQLSTAFDGDFLRSFDAGNPAPAAVLTLTGLAPSAPVEIKLSLAIIDSWDGSTFPPDQQQAPDSFNIRVNGVPEFGETFTNLTSLGSFQTHSDTALAQEVQLGFEESDFRLDSAYELSISTTADGSGSLVIEFFASGSGWHAPLHGRSRGGVLGDR